MIQTSVIRDLDSDDALGMDLHCVKKDREVLCFYKERKFKKNKEGKKKERKSEGSVELYIYIYCYL